MKKIIGFAIIALGIFLEFTWLGICFGSVIIGILLLIFAPRILFFPFNFFLVLGLVIMSGKNYKYYANYKRSENYSHNNYSNAQSSFNNIDRYYEILESLEHEQIVYPTLEKNHLVHNQHLYVYEITLLE